MDHLLAADALLGEQAALPIAQGGSQAHLAGNIFYFATRVVDKLWQGKWHIFIFQVKYSVKVVFVCMC